MASRFKDKLKAIRDASTRRHAEDLQQRSEEDLERTELRVKAFEFREGVEAIIEDLVKSFQGEAADFVLNRGFFEGKYMLALRLNEELIDENGQMERYFSRLLFLLNPNPDQNEFVLQCRKTVRNRDAESTVDQQPMTDDGRTALAVFVEKQFLEFAETYFGETTLRRPTTVGT